MWKKEMFSKRVDEQSVNVESEKISYYTIADSLTTLHITGVMVY